MQLIKILENRYLAKRDIKQFCFDPGLVKLSGGKQGEIYRSSVTNLQRYSCTSNQVKGSFKRFKIRQQLSLVVSKYFSVHIF